MCDILFRGKCKDNGEWVEGYYVRLFDDKGNISHRIYHGYAETDCGDFYPDWFEVDPNTLCQYTGTTEFVMTDKSFNEPLFEGDIVEINSRRRVNTGSFWIESRSQYDGEVKVRAVICFEHGKWRLDYKNAYNEKLCELKGNEQQDRCVTSSPDLYSFRLHSANEDWFREHNQHYKWDDIIKIGNIYDNPELLEVPNNG